LQRRTWVWLLVVAWVAAAPARTEEAAAPPPATSAVPAPAAPTTAVPDAAAPAAVIPTPTAAAPATPASAQPAGTSADIATEKRIVVLPPEFVVYQLSVGGAEPVPELTKAATENLLASANSALKAQPGFRLMELPQLDEASRATLREHVELFKIIAITLDFTVKPGGKPWQDVRDRTDYSVGDGLRFLRDKTGADYAFVMAGLERRQSGGSIFMQFALAAAGVGVATGAGSYVYCGVIDLRTGQLTWYGSKSGSKEFGMGTSANAAKKAGAESTVAAIFKGYPDSPGLNFKVAQAAR
jgi:hypothetical protein